MNKNSKVERIRMKIVDKYGSDSHKLRYETLADRKSFNSESIRMNFDQLRFRASHTV